MLEAGVVVAMSGAPIHWHLPAGRTAGSIPDTRELWDVLWSHRDELMGFAHSHPGSGAPSPSYTDVTTFAAIEASLGRRLDWWITSRDGLALVSWAGPLRVHYDTVPITCEPPWLHELRRLSYA